ncbi:hypothetical protein [Ruegeria sp.]|uniref:hypothetical protein n=1 Tax=Ruegeria sp. TaxID=1879320 RepID=UPI003B0082C8
MTQIVPQNASRNALSLNEAEFIDISDASPRIGRYVWVGVITLMAFVGGSAYWAFASKLDGAVVAPASFVVEGDRKTVEHLDGGIIRDIMIADGEFVEEGQPLIRLDSTDIDVDLNVLGSQMGELSVRRARLLAQMSGQDRVNRH